MPDFEKTFPALDFEMSRFYDQTNLHEIVNSKEKDSLFWDEQMPLLLKRIDSEVSKVIGQPWQQLKNQNSQFVAMHTLAVLAMTVNDPLFAALPLEQKNILKWAALLHDIAKLSRPTIEGKDHVHPFKSAAIVLELFETFGFIEGLTPFKRQ